MLRSLVGKIQKGFSVNVVRKGYFAVIAIKDGETKRFVVELEYLSDPAFLGLLDQARDEYGFRQKGTLALPCRPQELQNILDSTKRSYSYDDGQILTTFHF
ncbi:hypothetical protein VNO77_16134 [Canavalia gladiata]|uniref:Uncharacterized protein n=1 Tax=Canavalia gladiata TaxID=3824 RepID=A0AAN9QPN3_CANGL